MASGDGDDSPHHFSREEFVKAVLSHAKEINLDDDETSIDSLGDSLDAKPPGLDDSMLFCNESTTFSVLSMQSISCLGHDDSSGAFMEESVSEIDMEGLTLSEEGLSEKDQPAKSQSSTGSDEGPSSHTHRDSRWVSEGQRPTQANVLEELGGWRRNRL
jgi:hypothetical protein